MKQWIALIFFIQVLLGGVIMGNEPSVATFAGGCFWCMQPPYDSQSGVIKTTVGYTGGTKVNPRYEEVSSGSTGHTEAIQVEYDPKKITYQELLDIFWVNIDPTVKDKQFCDSGTQYRSAIYYHDEAQKKLALEFKKRLLEDRFTQVYTEIQPLSVFYPAEEYHQNFYIKSPTRYKFYRYRCGRDKRLMQVWGAS